MNIRIAKNCTLAAVGAALSCGAVGIEASNVTINQSVDSHIVTVDYTLSGAPAIVTVDFLTNGVSIGERNFANVRGDVNRILATDGNYSVKWNPARSPAATISFDGFEVSASVKVWPVEDPPDYLVVNLAETNYASPRVSYYVSTNALPGGGLANDIYRTDRLVMRRIHAAGVRWRMGAVSADYAGSDSDVSLSAREAAHGVTLSEDYFIGIYPVTQGQGAYFSSRGTAFTDQDDSRLRPAGNVKYVNLRGSGAGNGGAVKPTSALQELRTLTGVDFDLPTDAQWEYACRAGTTTLLYSGKALTSANVYELGWIYGNSLLDGTRQTHPVGEKLPNGWGLYDLYGNVNEWCRDWYVADLGTDDVVDPVGPATGSTRVLRGGNYLRGLRDWNVASSNRSGDIEDRTSNMDGFRLACPLLLTYE